MQGPRFNTLVAITTLCTASLTAAQDFRVETDVFVGRKQEPVAEYLTLFYGNYIYDFLLTDAQEITVFDVARNRFILLDPSRQVKTELTTSQVDAFHQELRERGLGRQDPFFTQQYEYAYKEAEQWHTVTGERVVYRARGITPKYPEAAERFRLFADWYAKLSSLRPGNLPPYGRLELNRILAENGQLPEDIEREATLSILPPRKVEARTHHLPNWLLSEPDHRRIRKAGDQIATFSSVAPDVYFQAQPLVKK